MFGPARIRWTIAAVAVAVALAACASNDPVVAGPSAAYPSFNASAEPTPDSVTGATASAEPTPSVTPAAQFALAMDVWPYDAYPMNDGGTALSGCAPGSADSLPDGVWYGWVREWSNESAVFDLACMYHPDSPEWSAFEEARAPDEPAIGYPTSNDNPATRTLAIASSAVQWDASYMSFPDDEPTPYVEALDNLTADHEYYLYVNDGRVTDIVPVYYP